MRPAFQVTVGADTPQVQTDVMRFAQRVGEVTGGTHLRGVAVGTSSTPVAHGMPCVPLGRVVTYKSAAGDVWDASKPDAKSLYLVASVAVTVDLWIF